MIGEILKRIGGRKFTAWAASTIGLLWVGASGRELPPEILNAVEVLFITFVGGNAAEHATRTISERRNGLSEAMQRHRDTIGAGEGRKPAEGESEAQEGK